MSWLSRLFGSRSESEFKPQRVDYLKEALLLERQGDYEAALTSYRLALREKPDDHRVLQNMAIAYSRTNRQDEAARCYRRALEIKPDLAGAHYGLGFLLLKKGETEQGLRHLEAFLAAPPQGGEAARWVEHAKAALQGGVQNGGGAGGGGAATPNNGAPAEAQP
ncbi:MAG TPA: tetratricopeptide repeat protein [Gemmatimonadaceae bacterium]|nr:tetratricopeptide repeat protein [Gemmatimonadaceae bacterium]